MKKSLNGRPPKYDEKFKISLREKIIIERVDGLTSL